MGARHTWFLASLALAFVVISGCKKGEGGSCFEISDCAEGLACVGASGELKRCEKCEGTADCSSDGRCTVKDGACVAASNEDCKKGYICNGKGACTAKDGKCTVGGDADCQQSDACKSQGYCIAKGNNCIKDKKAEKAEADKKAAEKKAAEEKEEKDDEKDDEKDE